MSTNLLEDLPEEIFRESHEEPDGSLVFDVLIDGENPEEEESFEEHDFYENLAHKMDRDKLKRLSSDLLDDIREDLASRSEWEDTANLSLKYLGRNVEEFKQSDFFKGCAAFDSAMSTTLLEAYSVARAELFPAAGPCKAKIIGKPTAEAEECADRVKDWTNYYLTDYDRSYYPDSEQLLMYSHFFGSAFRKVYQDPILNEPRSRFIAPQNFIVNLHTTDILSSSRITEVVFLSRKDVILRQKSGDFLDLDLPDVIDDEDTEDGSVLAKAIDKTDGVSKESSENKTLFKYYETHVDLLPEDVEDTVNKKDSDIPRSYVVTICLANDKVVSVKRNWEENNDKYIRKEYYVHYYFLRGFGIYGVGIAHLMGSNAITLTQILRQSVDANTFKNFPGFLKTKSFTSENNNIGLLPGEGREVETQGAPIGDCIMPMPYDGPSPVGIALREQLRQETASLGASTQQQIPDMGANASEGTVMALLEVAGRMQSTVLRSHHSSLSYELKLLFNVFRDYLPDKASQQGDLKFLVPGKESFISKEDFSDQIGIMPVSDPNVLTSTHRLVRDEASLNIASRYPELHNIREILHRIYSAMKVENIDQILPALPIPISLDPITENMNLLLGKPVIVSPGQDNKAHGIVHSNGRNDPIVQMVFQQNPAVYANWIIHEQQHKALEALEELEKQRMEQEMQQQMQQQQMNQMIGIPMMGEMPMQQMEQGFEQGMPQEQQNPMQDNKESEANQKKEELEQIQASPEIQNKVASDDAQAIIEQNKMMEEKQAMDAQNQIDPQRVMLVDIEQRREAAHLRDEESKRTAELDAYKIELAHEEVKLKVAMEERKAELSHEAEMAKVQAQLHIANEKNLVEIGKHENSRPEQNYER